MNSGNRLALVTLIAAMLSMSPATAKPAVRVAVRPGVTPAPVAAPAAAPVPTAPTPTPEPLPVPDPTTDAPSAEPSPTESEDEPETSSPTPVRPAAPTPTPSPTRTPSSTPPPAPSPSPSAQPTPSSQLGTTATAPANAESARVGALFVDGHHFCTASVITSPSGTFAITAAHCLSSTDGVTFVPGYRNGTAPYGTWRVTEIHTTGGWQRDENPDEDYALLEIAPDATGRTIQAAVGGNPLAFGTPLATTARLYGYPSRSDAPILCTNVTTARSAHQRRIDCPAFPGGTSGGPFIDTATGRVIGVIGGYQQGGNTEDISYSAAFDTTLATLFTEVTTA
ncbi:serine protease [Kitasatospora sp. NPDC002040]|uniref:trypsin-like serine peptidase n=1 Tax=Kitasatospora sp. NPDC002040 TaxID=3154661 RepID=UPI00332FAB72